AYAVSDSLAEADQSWQREPGDDFEPGFCADLPGCGGSESPRRYARPQLSASVARQAAERLAHFDVLSLLPSGPSQRRGALRRAHATLQADLLQQAQSMGTV